MSAVQQKIYDYFERDPELKVLFIFNNEFLAAELQSLEWRTGYRYVDFKGDWFTVKYNLDNDWQYDKVILMFHQPSPLARTMQLSFSNTDCRTQIRRWCASLRKTSCNYNPTRCKNCSLHIIKTRA